MILKVKESISSRSPLGLGGAPSEVDLFGAPCHSMGIWLDLVAEEPDLTRIQPAHG